MSEQSFALRDLYYHFNLPLPPYLVTYPWKFSPSPIYNQSPISPIKSNPKLESRNLDLGLTTTPTLLLSMKVNSKTKHSVTIIPSTCSAQKNPGGQQEGEHEVVQYDQGECYKRV